jgi:hypothetical protein
VGSVKITSHRDSAYLSRFFEIAFNPFLPMLSPATSGCVAIDFIVHTILLAIASKMKNLFGSQ